MPKPQDLNTVISVQPGAVVSRALVDNKAGTITLFAFKKFQSLAFENSKA